MGRVIVPGVAWTVKTLEQRKKWAEISLQAVEAYEKGHSIPRRASDRYLDRFATQQVPGYPTRIVDRTGQFVPYIRNTAPIRGVDSRREWDGPRDRLSPGRPRQ